MSTQMRRSDMSGGAHGMEYSPMLLRLLDDAASNQDEWYELLDDFRFMELSAVAALNRAVARQQKQAGKK